MATGAVNAANLLRGPGILYRADLGSALPANTVAAGKFPTAAFGTPWVALGATGEGSEFSDTLSAEPVEVAESYYAVQWASTGREATWTTALTEINKTNLKAALNGGTSTTTGTAGTTLTEVGPPAIGSEVRSMIGWQSEDDTVRLFGYQVLNVGNLAVAFRKGADKATLSMEWRFEKPATSEPWVMYLAGLERVK